jgi:hypothetical protein
MRNEKLNESQPMLLPFPTPRWGGAPAPGEGTSVLTCRLPEHAFPMAGFRHYNGAASIYALTPGTRLALRAEPNNPHDPFAVEIFQGPAKLGYVPSFCNRHISRLLQDSIPLACEVERVIPDGPPWEAVNVRILLPQQSVLAIAYAEPSGSSRF